MTKRRQLHICHTLQYQKTTQHCQTKKAPPSPKKETATQIFTRRQMKNVKLKNAKNDNFFLGRGQWTIFRWTGHKFSGGQVTKAPRYNKCWSLEILQDNN